MQRTFDLRVISLQPGDVRFVVRNASVSPSAMGRLRPYLRRVGARDDHLAGPLFGNAWVVPRLFAIGAAKVLLLADRLVSRHRRPSPDQVEAIDVAVRERSGRKHLSIGEQTYEATSVENVGVLESEISDEVDGAWDLLVTVQCEPVEVVTGHGDLELLQRVARALADELGVGLLDATFSG